MKSMHRLFALTALLMLALNAPLMAVECDQAVEEAVITEFDLDTSRYELEVLSNRLRTVDIAPGELSFVPLTHKEPLGLFTIMATITRNDEVVEQGQVRLRIRKFAEVLVTEDKIRRHDPLTENNLSLRRVEVTSLREQPVLSHEALLNCRAKRNIKKGQILTTMAIEPVPDIDVGREVTIVVSNDLLTITAPGKALQAGSSGEYVKVKNNATGRIISARVVDASSVAVDL